MKYYIRSDYQNIRNHNIKKTSVSQIELFINSGN